MTATSINYTQELFVEYGVSSEDELGQMLYDDAMTIPCANCGKELEWNEIYTMDGDPFCINCR